MLLKDLALHSLFEGNRRGEWAEVISNWKFWHSNGLQRTKRWSLAVQIMARFWWSMFHVPCRKHYRRVIILNFPNCLDVRPVCTLTNAWRILRHGCFMLIVGVASLLVHLLVGRDSPACQFNSIKLWRYSGYQWAWSSSIAWMTCLSRSHYNMLSQYYWVTELLVVRFRLSAISMHSSSLNVIRIPTFD